MFFDENDQNHRYQHEFDFSNWKFVQSVPNQRRLNFLEIIHILKNKHKNLIHKDDGPLELPMFDILINHQSNHT
jgi:hypothetical protein